MGTTDIHLQTDHIMMHTPLLRIVKIPFQNSTMLMEKIGNGSILSNQRAWKLCHSKPTEVKHQTVKVGPLRPIGPLGPLGPLLRPLGPLGPLDLLGPLGSLHTGPE